MTVLFVLYAVKCRIRQNMDTQFFQHTAPNVVQKWIWSDHFREVTKMIKGVVRMDLEKEIALKIVSAQPA